MENIKIGLQIDSNTKNETADAKKLHDQLKQAADAAGKIKVSGGAAKAAAQPGSKAASSAQPVGSQAVMEYGSLRGTAGATGASARDFANQAQGLSGLVRLYAIYAANLYAVTAAFQALSRAADTSNLVRGLDQLGAASGVSLGALSKELANSTGNALSFRDAMSATVKVTAAGLGSDNVLRLGQVATKASQALGVDLGDAVNRLSRGITKLEPELLDELGIFTKIDPAVQKYALSVGKTTSQLTDFERRQAFANAVLEEGEKKFAAIKVDANPYNKLAASLQNIGQSGLELVNKALVPIVNLLSSSPTTLITILAGLGASLLSKVIPALKELGTGSRRSADEALAALRETQAKAQTIRDQAAKVGQDRLNAAIDAAVAKADKAEQKLKALQTTSAAKTPEGVILTSQKAQIDPNDPGIKNAVSAAYIRARELAAQGDKEGAKALRDLANATKSYATDLNNLQKEQDLTRQSNQKFLDSNDKVAKSLENKAWRNNVVEQTKFNASVGGLGTALTILKNEVSKNEQGLGTWGKTLTLTRGYLAAFAGTLDKVAGAIGKVFFYIGIAIAAFEGIKAILNYFSSNAEKVTEFNNTVTTAEDRVKNLNSTVAEINKKSFLEQVNAESILAKSTAVAELATSSEKLINSFSQQDRAASGLDKFVDGFKRIVGAEDNATKLGKSLAANIFGALKGASGSPEAKQAKESLAKILEIDATATEKEFANAIASMSSNSGKMEQINSTIKNFSKNLSDSAKTSAELKSGLDETDKSYKEFLNSLSNVSGLDKVAKNIRQNAIQLAQSLEDPSRALADLVALADSASATQIFSSESFANLQKYKAELKDLLNEQVLQASVAADNEKTYLAALKEVERVKNLPKTRNRASQISEAETARDVAKENLDSSIQAAEETKKRGLEVARQFNYLTFEAFDRGAKVTEAKISAAFSKSSTLVAEGLLGMLGDIPGTARLRAEINIQQIDVQQNLLRAQLNQIEETRRNTVQLQLQNARSALQEMNKNAGELGIVDESKASGLRNLVKTLETELLKPVRSAADVKTAREGLRNLGPNENVSAAMRVLDEQLEQLVSRSNLLAGLKEGEAKKRLEIITKEAKQIKEGVKAQEDGYNANIKDYEVDIKKYDAIEARTGFLTESQQILRDMSESAKLAAEQDLQSLITRTKIAQTEFIINKLKNEGKKDPELEADLARSKSESEKQLGRDQAARAELADRQSIKAIANAQKQKAFELGIQSVYRERSNILADTNSEAEQLSFNIFKSTTKLSEAFLIEKEASFSRSKLVLDNDRALTEARIANEQKVSDIRFKLAQLKPEDTEAKTRLETELAAENSLYDAKVTRLNSINELKLKEVDTQERLNLKQADYNKLLENVTYITDSIRGAFEGLGDNVQRFGTGLADFTDTFAKFAVDSQKSTDNIKALQDASNEAEIAGNYELAGKYAKEAAQATKKQQKDELAGYAKLAGGAKKMFGEKTAAAKLFGAVEKAIHIAKLASNAQEMVSNLLSAKTGVAASIMKAVAAGKAAIANAFNLPPPFGFAAGAAMTAIIAGLLGSAFSGNKGGSAPAITAEQRQETQGTAMGFNAAGEKTQVRRGVFGDTEAKSESISNSLEAIKDSSVLGLSNDNKVVKALEKINRTLETSAQELYRIEGLRTGSAIGTVEGTKTSGIIGLFGKTTTNEIIDSGLKLQGTFLELAKASGGVVQGFETVKTTTKKSGFLGIGGSTRTNVTTNTFGLDPKALEAIQAALGGGFEVISALGEQAGLTQSIIESQLANVRVDELVSLRGLKGEELQKELSSVVSAILDDASLAVFQSFEQFAKFGEGMLETVSRVTDTNRKVEAALQNLTGNAQDLSFELTETIAQNFGGVKQFTESIQEFTDRFLTDAERLQIQRTGLQRELDRLGYGYVRTKDDFKQAIQGLINSGQAGSELFASMMKLQGSMLAVSEATKQTNTNLQSAYDSRVKELQGARDEFKKFAESLRDYRQSLLTGSQSPLTPMQQYLETQLEYERVRGLAQAGDKDAIQKLQGAASAFLQSSQRMYASSAEYVQDFDRVTQDITSVSNYADSQASLADQTLLALQNQFSTLVDISVNTERAAVELTGLGPKLAEALNAYNLSGAAMGMAFDTGGVRKYALGGIVAQMTPFQHSAGLGVMGEAGPEAIMPLTRMSGGELGVRMAGDVNQQLAKLNQQIAELTQVVANGAVMNAQATDRNTEAVVEAVGSTAETTQYQTRLQNRTKIV